MILEISLKSSSEVGMLEMSGSVCFYVNTMDDDDDEGLEGSSHFIHFISFQGRHIYITLLYPNMVPRGWILMILVGSLFILMLHHDTTFDWKVWGKKKNWRIATEFCTDFLGPLRMNFINICDTFPDAIQCHYQIKVFFAHFSGLWPITCNVYNTEVSTELSAPL